MAPFYKTAAAFCLAGLFGLQSVAATETKYKFETSEAKEEAYLTVRLARNGKITATTNDVARDEDVLAALQEKFVTENTAQEPTCAALINEKLKKVFHVSFSYTETPNYSKLVEGALKNGLEAFSNTYPKDTSAWATLWKSTGAPSLLHLLGASSTKVACVVANCVKKNEDLLEANSEPEAPTKSVLFCELSPAATEGQAAFSEEYFNELIARQDKLKSMTKDDLKDPIVTSSASAAFPSILTAGLVAVLAAISA